jgi:hypothetical protein
VDRSGCRRYALRLHTSVPIVLTESGLTEIVIYCGTFNIIESIIAVTRSLYSFAYNIRFAEFAGETYVLP